VHPHLIADCWPSYLGEGGDQGLGRGGGVKALRGVRVQSILHKGSEIQLLIASGANCRATGNTRKGVEPLKTSYGSRHATDGHGCLFAVY
jgi:hypothetical protein